jgi:hypothetical protein
LPASRTDKRFGDKALAPGQPESAARPTIAFAQEHAPAVVIQHLFRSRPLVRRI